MKEDLRCSFKEGPRKQGTLQTSYIEQYSLVSYHYVTEINPSEQWTCLSREWWRWWVLINPNKLRKQEKEAWVYELGLSKTHLFSQGLTKSESGNTCRVWGGPESWSSVDRFSWGILWKKQRRMFDFYIWMTLEKWTVFRLKYARIMWMKRKINFFL